MDPMYQALSSQGLLLGQHDRFLCALVDSNQYVSAHISELSHQGSTPASSVQDSRLPSLIEVAPASLASRDIHVSDPYPSVQEYLAQCKRVWPICTNLARWFCCLQITFHCSQSPTNLPPPYIVPLTIDKLTNPSAVNPKLPDNMEFTSHATSLRSNRYALDGC